MEQGIDKEIRDQENTFTGERSLEKKESEVLKSSVSTVKPQQDCLICNSCDH